MLIKKEKRIEKRKYFIYYSNKIQISFLYQLVVYEQTCKKKVEYTKTYILWKKNIHITKFIRKKNSFINNVILQIYINIIFMLFFFIKKFSNIYN